MVSLAVVTNATDTKPRRYSLHDYRAIREWDRRLGSSFYYTHEQIAKAKRDGAPEDAIYKRTETGEWATVSDLAPDHPFRLWYEEAVNV